MRSFIEIIKEQDRIIDSYEYLIGDGTVNSMNEENLKAFKAAQDRFGEVQKELMKAAKKIGKLEEGSEERELFIKVSNRLAEFNSLHADSDKIEYQ